MNVLDGIVVEIETAEQWDQFCDMAHRYNRQVLIQEGRFSEQEHKRICQRFVETWDVALDRMFDESSNSLFMYFKKPTDDGYMFPIAVGDHYFGNASPINFEWFLLFIWEASEYAEN